MLDLTKKIRLPKVFLEQNSFICRGLTVLKIIVGEIDQIVTNVKDNLGFGLTCVFSALVLL